MSMRNLFSKKALIFLPLIFIQATLVACVSGDVKSKPDTTTTIILIRHAEKIIEGLKDGTYLLPEGRARAQALVGAVQDMDITAIYSPDVGRNLETVEPLSEKIGVDVTVIKNMHMFKVDTIADDILANHAGGVALFVGNVSGNLMAMYAYLGGTGERPLSYGDMAIFTITDQGTQSVVSSHFGN